MTSMMNKNLQIKYQLIPVIVDRSKERSFELISHAHGAFPAHTTAAPRAFAAALIIMAIIVI